MLPSKQTRGVLIISKARTHYICEICGYESSSFQKIEKCEAYGIREAYHEDVKEGDVVTLHKATWIGSRLRGPLVRQRYRVMHIYYSTPDDEYDTTLRRISPHTLCIELRSSLKTRGEAWEGEGGYGMCMLQYQNFVLFRECNRTKLEIDGLIVALPWWKKLTQKFSRAA